MTRQTIPGGCFCGAVRFEIDRPIKWCAHCHCSMCRRAHGAPYVTWVSVPEAQFRVVAGEADVAERESSPGAHRAFCRACGSPFRFRSVKWPGEVHVARALLADDEELPAGVHAFTAGRAAWVALPDDGLPRT